MCRAQHIWFAMIRDSWHAHSTMLKISVSGVLLRPFTSIIHIIHFWWKYSKSNVTWSCAPNEYILHWQKINVCCAITQMNAYRGSVLDCYVVEAIRLLGRKEHKTQLDFLLLYDLLLFYSVWGCRSKKKYIVGHHVVASSQFKRDSLISSIHTPSTKWENR